MGATHRKFLVIDDHVDNRFLLTRTLQRKYPGAVVTECSTLAAALAQVGRDGIDAVVSHRAGELDGLELVRELRRAAPAMPIVMVSGLDRTRAALTAGATRFLNYDEWLRLGTVMEEIFLTQPWAGVIAALTHAIRRHLLVTFDYRPAENTTAHEVEPHLLGTTADGAFVLRAHAAGHSRRSGGGWETFSIAHISNLAFTEQSFAPHNGDRLDRQIARVLCEA